MRRIAFFALMGWLGASIFAASTTDEIEGPSSVPWLMYEAEDMTTSGEKIGPAYLPDLVAAESSERRYVRLEKQGAYVEFSAQRDADAVVIRYCIPDSKDGTGNDATLSLYKNGDFVRKVKMTSRYSWLYGAYPFTNKPSDGSPRNFYDEARLKNFHVRAHDVIRLQKDTDDSAEYYNIDLVDLENAGQPRSAPEKTNSLSVVDFGAAPDDGKDDTAAIQECINAARAQRKNVWIPAGDYLVAGDLNNLQEITIQGAGMWHTTLHGDPAQYNRNPQKRVRFNGSGGGVHLSDFAIIGRLNYRNDSEPNDGFGESYGSGSSITRVWVEHTKTGVWAANSDGLVVRDCRFRNTISDGVNFCVGMRNSMATNCTARGTGDDAFAIWPATYTAQSNEPGLNVITHCRAELSFLGNGYAIYGGRGNRVSHCVAADVPYGCGALISSTFPVGTNVFSGITVVENSHFVRTGGYDRGFQWRGALQLCVENESISGVEIRDLKIIDAISDGISVIAAGKKRGSFSNITLSGVNVMNCGLGIKGRFGLWINSNASGAIDVRNSVLGEVKNESRAFTVNR